MAGGADLYLDVGRGCPFKCTFCSTAPFWKRAFRMKSIGRIIQEMALVRTRYGINHINFSHDLFTGNMRWVERFCDSLAAANLMMTWSCSTRTDRIHANCWRGWPGPDAVEIYYGIDSGSAKNQTEIGKDLDLHQAYNIVRTTRSCGIRPVTGFICGYPMERKEDFEETLRGYFETLRLGRLPQPICCHFAVGGGYAGRQDISTCSPSGSPAQGVLGAEAREAQNRAFSHPSRDSERRNSLPSRGLRRCGRGASPNTWSC